MIAPTIFGGIEHTRPCATCGCPAHLHCDPALGDWDAAKILGIVVDKVAQTDGNGRDLTLADLATRAREARAIRRRPRKTTSQGGPAMTEAKWHVSNLPYETNEEQIEKLFADLGKVGPVYLARHPDKRLKGFGFIELLLYRDEQASRIDAYGRKLHGRPVKLRIAHPDARAA